MFFSQYLTTLFYEHYTSSHFAVLSPISVILFKFFSFFPSRVYHFADQGTSQDMPSQQVLNEMFRELHLADFMYTAGKITPARNSDFSRNLKKAYKWVLNTSCKD